ncbi:MAG: tetratricopeptide repeat protein [Anaerolineae bacterium]
MEDWIRWPPTWSTLLLLPALFVGFTVHELAHAVVAYLLGDTSQVERKRLSLNPLRHVSWIGLAVFLLFGFGWAKPVWFDPSQFRMRNRAFGMFLVSVSGAVANLLLGLLALLGITATVLITWGVRGVPAADAMAFLMISQPGLDLQGAAVALSSYMLTVNLLLALFNLIPIPPLDGFQAMVSLVAAIRTAFRREPVPQAAPELAAQVEDDGEDTRSPAQIHFDIGLQYHKEGQYDEAVARYRQATAHNEDFGLAYYNLGLAYWAKARLPLATSAFRAVLRADAVPALRLQADLHLRALLRAERDPDTEAGRPPEPVEVFQEVEPVREEPRAVDPTVARRLALRLTVGGVAGAVLGVAAWVFVTVVTLTSVG